MKSIFWKVSCLANQFDYFNGNHNFLSTITVVLIAGLIACLFLLIFAYLDIKLNNQKN